MEAIKVENIWKRYGKVWVLKNFSLSVKKGECKIVKAPCGSGKTTLLKIIAGLERQDKGRVYLRGKLVASEKIFVPAEERNVSMVFQNLALWPHLTVEEHLKIVKNDEKKISEVLRLLNLKKHKHKKPAELSGGERQCLAIARALMKESDILLLDEPFAYLDRKLKERVKEILEELRKKRKVAMIITMH